MTINKKQFVRIAHSFQNFYDELSTLSDLGYMKQDNALVEAVDTILDTFDEAFEGTTAILPQMIFLNQINRAGAENIKTFEQLYDFINEG